MLFRSDLSHLLSAKHGKKAIVAFDQMEDTDCHGCGHKDTYLYVVAPDRDNALDLIQQEEAGLCGNCMCNLLANSPTTISGDHLFVGQDVVSNFDCHTGVMDVSPGIEGKIKKLEEILQSLEIMEGLLSETPDWGDVLDELGMGKDHLRTARNYLAAGDEE